MHALTSKSCVDYRVKEDSEEKFRGESFDTLHMWMCSRCRVALRVAPCAKNINKHVMTDNNRSFGGKFRNSMFIYEAFYAYTVTMASLAPSCTLAIYREKSSCETGYNSG